MPRRVRRWRIRAPTWTSTGCDLGIVPGSSVVYFADYNAVAQVRWRTIRKCNGRHVRQCKNAYLHVRAAYELIVSPRLCKSNPRGCDDQNIANVLTALWRAPANNTAARNPMSASSVQSPQRL